MGYYYIRVLDAGTRGEKKKKKCTDELRMRREREMHKMDYIDLS